MEKQKKQEIIVAIVTIVFVSIMAGLKMKLGVVNTLLVIVIFICLYLVLNYFINKLLAPIYRNREKLNKNKALIGKPKKKRK